MKTKQIISYIQRKDWEDILRIQTTLLKSMQQFMIRKGFVELMPVITSKFTDPLGPDPGSSVIKTPSIEYYDQKLVLTQSMILHKQLAILAYPKIFIFSPNVRLERRERRKTGKHLFEFTQMDFEIAYAKMKNVFKLVEDLVVYTIKQVKKERKEELRRLGRKLKVPSKPFKKYTTHELEEKYGKEWEIKASKDHKEPFWAICHKREFYDKEDPERPGHYLNYDLIWPEGFGEALSGGEREYQYQRIVQRIKRDGLPIERYKEYLEIAKLGILKPSAGAGIGVERFLRFLTGKKHVGDIQLFRRVPGEEVIL
ncbi:MAG: asparagine synthetase [Candidatus Aenigmarchaeota archaeon ex4484_224]|nr:MAG: asparagine synthetase [Candidatus Aenigmarchaeota archaeon ex4484_224]